MEELGPKVIAAMGDTHTIGAFTSGQGVSSKTCFKFKRQDSGVECLVFFV